MRIRDNLVRLYAQMTGQTQEQITIDLDRDNFMWLIQSNIFFLIQTVTLIQPYRSAEKALEYGLIDKIIEVNENKWSA